MNRIADNREISHPGTAAPRASRTPVRFLLDNATSTTRVSRATIRLLIADLASTDGSVRVKARQQLVAYKKTSVAPLIKTLTDAHDHVRWEAAKALSQIGSPKAIRALIKSLEDETFEVRWLAAVGLIQIGRRAIVPLLDTLVNHSDSFWLREGAHHVLHDMKKKNISEILRPVMLALEGIEPSLETPFAAKTALDAIKAKSL